MTNYTSSVWNVWLILGFRRSSRYACHITFSKFCLPQEYNYNQYYMDYSSDLQVTNTNIQPDKGTDWVVIEDIPVDLQVKLEVI